MRKALVNYWVDMVTGLAFVFCAVTGIVRLFPEATTLAASGAPTILGISTALWATIHDWSGVIMAAGVGVHTVLHLRWLAHMTRRIAGGDTKRSRGVVPAGAGRATRVPATPAAASAVTGSGGPLPGAPRVVAAAELERLERRWDTRRRENERRHTRKAFLSGAAAVGGAALLVGLGLTGRDAAGSLLDGSAEQASADEVGWNGSAEADDSEYGSSSQGSSAGDGSTGGATATTTRVAVDPAILRRLRRLSAGVPGRRVRGRRRRGDGAEPGRLPAVRPLHPGLPARRHHAERIGEGGRGAALRPPRPPSPAAYLTLSVALPTTLALLPARSSPLTTMR